MFATGRDTVLFYNVLEFLTDIRSTSPLTSQSNVGTVSHLGKVSTARRKMSSSMLWAVLCFHGREFRLAGLPVNPNSVMKNTH